MLATFLENLRGRIVSQKQQAVMDALKAIPAVGVTAWDALASAPVEKWVSAATLVYVVLQMFYLVRDRRRKERKERFFEQRRAK